MIAKIDKLIFYSYSLVFFVTPLIFFTKTSEIFEFNKIVFTYIFALIILFLWIVKSFIAGKIIFRRTILDKALVFFLLTQIVSTFLSIDKNTSIFGFYTRFNGGLLSTISYMVLYWALVSNIGKEKLKTLINLILLSAIFVSVYGILQRFGIDKDFWSQKVQLRVFSTMGQPNWLAAWLVVMIPLTYSKAIVGSGQRLKVFSYMLFVLFFTAFLFTQSRSGLIAYLASSIVFWVIAFWKYKKRFLTSFLLVNISAFILVFLIGTPWTPKYFINQSNNNPAGLPAEVGTESGEIRKIVWKGALNIWRSYPIFGSGVETFAYSYNKYKPVEHNTISEWDFVFNKAHNEYLNYAANSGLFGLLSYLLLIATIILAFSKKIFSKITEKETASSETIYTLAVFSGFFSILVTNFFGFSVVGTSILFFLLPGFIFLKNSKNQNYQENLSNPIFIITTILFFLFLFLFDLIARYWYADFLYASGKSYNRDSEFFKSRSLLVKSIKINKNQPQYFDELAESSVGLALYYHDIKDENITESFINSALTEMQHAIKVSPSNIYLRKNLISRLLSLSVVDMKYLSEAENSILDAIELAPNDPKLYYDLALILTKTKRVDQAMELFNKTIEIKPNYKEARFALALIYKQNKNYAEAKKQLEYIIQNIDPKDKLTRQELDSLR